MVNSRLPALPLFYSPLYETQLRHALVYELTPLHSTALFRPKKKSNITSFLRQAIILSISERYQFSAVTLTPHQHFPDFHRAEAIQLCRCFPLQNNNPNISIRFNCFVFDCSIYISFAVAFTIHVSSESHDSNREYYFKSAHVDFHKPNDSRKSSGHQLLLRFCMRI